MSAFKVGQRVRIVDAPDMVQRHWVGCEVTILAMPGCSVRQPDNYEVSRPATEADPLARCFFCPPHHLSPLLDPGADAFMERIKRLGREPINEIEKVTK